MKKVEKKDNSANVIKLSIILIATCLILFGVVFVYMDKTADSRKFAEEYESLNGTKREKDGKTIRNIEIPSSSKIVYSSPEEISKKIDNKETFVVYFGFDDCPWCRSVVPTLIEVCNELKVDKLYYVDVKELRDVKELDENNNIVTVKESGKGYDKLLKQLGDVLSDYTLVSADGSKIQVGEKRIFAPNVITIKNGIPLKNESGISDKETDPYMTLTKDMKNETYNKFKKAIKEILK